jgi:hypothetical protein
MRSKASPSLVKNHHWYLCAVLRTSLARINNLIKTPNRFTVTEQQSLKAVYSVNDSTIRECSHASLIEPTGNNPPVRVIARVIEQYHPRIFTPGVKKPPHHLDASTASLDHETAVAFRLKAIPLTTPHTHRCGWQKVEHRIQRRPNYTCTAAHPHHGARYTPISWCMPYTHITVHAAYL